MPYSEHAHNLTNKLNFFVRQPPNYTVNSIGKHVFREGVPEKKKDFIIDKLKNRSKTSSKDSRVLRMVDNLSGCSGATHSYLKNLEHPLLAA